jgi:hypothetical protein
MPRRLPTLTLALAALAAAHVADPSLARAEDKAKPAWKTERHIIEVGGYLGAFFPAKDHGLYGEGVTMTPRSLKTGFDIGLRFAYLPLRFVGVEVEGGAVPTKAVWTGMDGQEKRQSAVLYGLRGHVILQLPTQLSLFVLAGGGVLGVSSKNDSLGKNVDGTLHVGGGLKYYATQRLVLRIDGRDVIAPAFTKGMPGGPEWTHHAEFTFGAAFVLGRKSTKMLKR